MTRIDSPFTVLHGGQAQSAGGIGATGPALFVTLAESPASLARLTAGSILEGVVLNQDVRGLTQLRTEHGTIAFRTQLALPKGTQLVLQEQTTGSQIQVGILGMRAPAGESIAGSRPAGGSIPAPASAAAPPTGPGPVQGAGLHAAANLAGQWPSLEAALAALTAAGSPAAQALQSVIPQPNANVAPALLFFIAALTRGDVRSWLGSEVGRALTTAGRRDIADRLTEDFNLLSRVAADSARGDWRAFLLPFNDGGHVSQVHFFLRRDRSGGKRPGDAEPLGRFVFEVDLSRLGRLQLDGLAGPRRFDLMVRSLAPLPEEIRAEIRAIFATARADARLEGDIAFQAVSAFAIAPLDAALGPDAGMVV